MPENTTSERIYDQLVERAENAFRDGHFLEAFLIQSCLIEGVIKLCTGIHFAQKLTTRRLTQSVERAPISRLIELLYMTDVIQPTFYEQLQRYLRERNKVVHELLTYNAQQRDRALQDAYASGREMKSFIVDELIHGKIQKTLAQIEEITSNLLENTKE